MEKPVGKAEMQMAKQLIQSITSEWEPEQYTDQYHEALEKKIEHGGEEPSVPVKKKKATNVVDLVSVLEQSIQQTQAKSKSENSTKKTRSAGRKKAA